MQPRVRFLKIASVIGTILAIAALGAAAFAASPLKGAKYTGHLKKPLGAVTVNFKVSPSGEKVVGMKIEPVVPNRCGSGGGTPPPQVSKPTKIKHGKFSVLIKEELDNGAVSGEATVSGEFLPGGKVKGVVKVPIPGAAECAGNFPYSGKAKR